MSSPPSQENALPTKVLIASRRRMRRCVASVTTNSDEAGCGSYLLTSRARATRARTEHVEESRIEVQLVFADPRLVALRHDAVEHVSHALEGHRLVNRRTPAVTDDSGARFQGFH